MYIMLNNVHKCNAEKVRSWSP